MKLSSLTRGSLELSLAMCLSGLIGYFVLQSGQTAWNLVFFRCLLGVLVLGPYAVWRGRAELRHFTVRNGLLTLGGGLALICNWVLLFRAFDHIPFSVATVTYHMQPLLLVLGGAWLAGERVSKPVWCWLGIAFIGVVLISGLGVNDLFFMPGTAISSPLLGIVLATGAAALYTVCTLLTKHTPELPSHLIAFAQVSLGVPIGFSLMDLTALPSGLTVWGSLAFLGLINTGLQYILMYASFQRLSTELIAALSFIYPVAALLVDHLALGTQFSVSQLLGIPVILLAAAAVRFGWQPQSFLSRLQSKQI
jgi:drug/metabolite transporter (DMT)-like permease